MCEMVVERLKETHTLFFDAKLLKGGLAGGLHEQLKIGRADEFDFMIETPLLADKRYLSLTISKTTGQIHYHFTDDFRLLFDNLSDDLMNEVWIEDAVWFYLKRTCLKVFEDLFQQYMRPNWSLISKGHHGMGTPVAITIYLKWCGKLEIGIDFVLAIPTRLRPLPLIKMAKHKELFTELVIKESELHYLLTGRDTCRLSCGELEHKLLSNYGINSGQKVCLRAAKFLLSKFVLKQCPIIDDVPGWESTIDSEACSYWIKTISFTLFEKYPSDEDWEKPYYGQRLLELFQLLHSAVENCELYNYFIPSCNLFSQLVTRPEVVQLLNNQLSVLIEHLQMLESNKAEEHQAFEKLEQLANRREWEAKNLYLTMTAKDELYVMLHNYALDAYNPVWYTRIQNFMREHLPNMRLNGKGCQCTLYGERGEKININQHLVPLMGENESMNYFELQSADRRSTIIGSLTCISIGVLIWVWHWERFF
ncbi:unnamed protein product [Didymodactylos carnosus]|uniref:Mab-21-like HhH/H2TH-like domain-containing protein n=1 Tax=Didymodactylos carnosus TaxID=1234261 RepID=A0A815TBQ7_9BILA|nr:unnamed protein product [Didymodactylos carnosus]CAF1506039.1 unnamed protein product [Didymodactylos carnosus]CAF3860670.1 unnamed protein product [Didymodactylos carnosus]CAF4367185.1 unnamed protein product [Didymodactylos carnosus]